MKTKSIITRSLVLLILFGFNFSAQAQSIAPSTFKHVATSTNTRGNVTTIDNAGTNNSPNSILFVTHDYGSRGPYVTVPLGVWYSNNKWTIFTQDRSSMPANAKFNVLRQTLADRGVFVHTASSSSISGHITTINHPDTNNKPNAKLMVTQSYGSRGPYNANAIGVYYSGGKWRIYNQNKAAMPINAKFNILVDHVKSFKHTVSSSSRTHITELNNEETNNKPNAFVFTTQLWEGVYNAHTTGVWYNGNKWKIYNEDRQPLSGNAKFNVIAFSLGGSGGTSGETASSRITLPKTTFTTVVNSFLAGMRIKLNNHGARHRDSGGDVSWFEENSSMFSLGGVRVNFTIPEYSRGVRDKRSYINDMNLTRATSSFERDDLHLNLTFEENGPEIKSYCSTCAKFREDNASPDYQFENNRWDIKMSIVPFDGSLTFNVDEVKYLGSVDGKVFGELFDGIVKRHLIPIMEEEFRTAFNNQRAYVANEIRRYATAAGIDLSRVTRVSYSGGNIILHTESL